MWACGTRAWTSAPTPAVNWRPTRERVQIRPLPRNHVPAVPGAGDPYVAGAPQLEQKDFCWSVLRVQRRFLRSSDIVVCEVLHFSSTCLPISTTPPGRGTSSFPSRHLSTHTRTQVGNSNAVIKN